MTFEFALHNTLRHEGGYSNDPRDPGGETNLGLSKRAYPNLDIKNLTLEQASEIYRRDYWDKIRGDSLPPSLAILCFDTAVNMGVQRAVMLLQEACGVTVDGVIGPNTLKAAQKAPLDVLERMATGRILRYIELDGFKVYGRGWVRRTLSTVLAAAGK